MSKEKHKPQQNILLHLARETEGTYPIVGLMFGSKLSSTNLQTILDFPTPVSCKHKKKSVS